MFKGTVRVETAKDDDAELLAQIRVEAMRPSLEAVSRFDPERARNRSHNIPIPTPSSQIPKNKITNNNCRLKF